jgi:hypothetical protein
MSIGKRILPPSDTERMLIYTLTILVIKRKFIAIVTIYQNFYYYICFFKNFIIIRGGHNERAAGGGGREADTGQVADNDGTRDGKGVGECQSDGNDERHDGVMGT